MEKEITAGSWIVYGKAIGIQFAFVVGVETKVRAEGEYTPEGDRITVVRVERGWRDETLEVAKSKSTVYMAHRTMVIPESVVPNPVRCEMRDRLDQLKIILP